MAKKKVVPPYRVEIECNNCGQRKVFLVPKGLSVRDWIEGKLCSRCKLFWTAMGWKRVNVNLLWPRLR